MKSEFLMSEQSAIVNFTVKYCDTGEKLLNSYAFKKVLTSYLEKLRQKDNAIYNHFIGKSSDSIDGLVEDFTNIFKLLLVLEVKDFESIHPRYATYFENREIFVEFIEDLYSFWRRMERYTVVYNSKKGHGLQNVGFIEANNDFNNLVLYVYRRIEETVMGYKHRVYRQLTAGGNAGLILNKVPWHCPAGYTFLKRIPFIETVILQPPFITYPKVNKRSGYFKEVDKNPLEEVSLNEHHWFCYPAKVGDLLAYVYFHKDFICQGVTLSNLFELATAEECKNRKPDMIYLYGIKDFSPEMSTVFYNDKENDIIVGYANYNDGIDYFGYMKKMLLTLHNVKMMDRGALPLHGAMVNITTKTNKEWNVVIIGDSGAGKSESLEAFRILSEDYIKDMKIIFDDMGILSLSEDNQVMGSGTEIGAFVRLDDLDTGYAYKSMDRSIFMNPDKENARLVIPIATYEEITKRYPIDYFFYANNYADEQEITYFDTPKAALKVFKEGARMAKGTTSESGLVKSYFANPFGPYQKKSRCDALLNKYFSILFERGVKVGELRTRLGIEGMEKEGPKRAAKKLLELLNTEESK